MPDGSDARSGTHAPDDRAAMATGLAIAILVIGAVLGVAQVALARARAGAPAALWVGMVGALTALWCAAYALEVAAGTEETVVLLARVEWISVAFIPLAMLMCAVTFRGDRLPAREIAALAVPGIIALALAWTNGAHRLLWSDITREAGHETFTFSPGPAYVMFVIYAYLLLSVGTAMVVAAVRGLPDRQRSLMPLVLVAIGLPWVANFAFHIGVRPADVDFTPVALSLTGMLMTYAILRLRILDVFRGLIPAGRDATVRLMADGVVVVDRHGNVADANPAACALAGRSPREVLGIPAATAFPEWPGEVLADTGDEPAVITAATGGGRTLEITVSPLQARGGVATGRIVVVRDVTDRVHAERALQTSERRYRELVENASDVVFAAEAGGRVIALNRAGRALLGVGPDGLSAGEILGGGPGGPVPEALLDRLRRHGRATTDVEVHAADGRRVALEMSVRLLGQPADGLIEGIGRDVTERRSWEERLTWRALHDPLTELPNRTLVRDRLEQALRASARDGGPMALLLIDLDHFKDVNDTLGHSVGDRVLGAIGERLQPHLREADTLGRLGGDEFAAVLPGATEDVARLVAHRLLAALEQPFVVDDHAFALGGSVGIAMGGGRGIDGDELLRRADTAMYRAKATRRSVVAWSPVLDHGPLGRLGLREALLSAVDRDELELHYQPQVRIRDGSVAAVEALVRWHHPERGLLRPAAFIPLAEQLGVIDEVTRWVVRRALRDCAAWRAAGRHVRVAVNLSPLTLECGDDLTGFLRDALADTAADPSWLKVELTESAVVDDLERGGRLLGDIADLGVAVSIDDFGVGYSSLAHLRRLPVSELKVDRLFVRDMGDDGDEAIVRSVIALGHHLGLAVVAEGIEDVATWQVLERLGCDLGQGFHVSPPLPADALLPWIEERDALTARA
ncbi:MAG: EAL domain-containing protein [Thermoleophilia bacterium]